MEQPKITVYGTFWRSDCRQSRQFFGEQRVRYNRVAIDENEEGRKRIHELNDDKQIILTIIFQDGSIFVEPSNAELAAKLSVSSEAKREYYDLVIVGSGPVGLTTACMPPEKGSRLWSSRRPAPLSALTTTPASLKESTAANCSTK